MYVCRFKFKAVKIIFFYFCIDSLKMLYCLSLYCNFKTRVGLKYFNMDSVAD